MTVERLMTAIGMRIFIKYYDYFKRGIDIINKLEEEGFTLKSCRSRQSKAQRIFRENLQVEALKMVLNANKVSEETKNKAIELLRSEKNERN
ncbi:MAG TPA: hypothetical protein PL056_14050 [bacterium]|nr:hypothetical protein [bacterium]